MSMKNTRCEEVIIQCVIRTYDDHGRPVSERVSNPEKLFRNAETLDFWAVVDKAVKAFNQPEAPVKPTGKKR